LGIQPKAELRTRTLSLMTGATFTQYRGERWGWEVVTQVSYTWKKTTLNGFFKYQGQTPIFLGDEEGNVQWRWIGGFPWLDLSISRPFWRGHFHVVLGLRNALNITNVQANLAGGVHSGGGFNSPVGMGRYPFIRIEYLLQKGQL
ncbi:MAG: hypothetical protein N2170_01610, partial [Bacteroidia bacterium]|nr:hypothetical protein [Bacteroidia bacterium]